MSRSAPRWPWWLAAYALALLAVLWPTAVSMVRIWSNSETFAHGFVILPIALWLAWRDRDALARLPWRPQPAALAPCLLASLVGLVGRLADVLLAQQLALVALLGLGAWALLGTRLALRLAFPLGFLFFAVPMGLGLQPPLMDLTADWTVRLVRATGVPVYQEGRFFELPSGRWSVVEACSGVRYLIASVTLGVLYAFLNYRALWRRLAFIGLAIVVPILANVLRAYGIVMLGHLSNMRLATGVDHLIYGWLFFGVVMLLLFWVGRFWQETDLPPSGVVTSPPQSAAPADTAVPRRALPTALGALLIAALPVLLAGHSPAPGSAGGEPLSLALSGWQRSGLGDDAWRPPLRGAQRHLDRRYVGARGAVIQLHLRQFIDQSQGAAELVSHHDPWLAEDSRWRVSLRRRVAAGALRGLEVREVELVVGPSRLLAWTWYRIGDRRSAGDATAKLLEALAALRGAGRGAAQLYLATPLDSEAGDAGRVRARQTLEAFLADNAPQLAAALRSGLRDSGA